MSNENLRDRNEARLILEGLHNQVCFENGDHPDEVNTAYSIGADAIARATLATITAQTTDNGEAHGHD